ncbi:STAS domain-containing protein [Streptosporangium lutulentum]|uniref:Anti-sigma factor antagonist n=1 Tax=Streptosporangium lutulentum TaxID=1461250 RepID=A0ABT9QGU5_9ACTN|nr:STAS domain-containing protein [Streptosporangium lutulentum]MDP9845981.1 anti-anti-sigma factor [Streptosporangium lutulentum]
MDDRKQALRVQVTQYEHCTVLEIGGALDFLTAPIFADHIDTVWDLSEGPCLVLELSQLTFYDSTALAALIYLLHRIQAAPAGRLLLVSVPRNLEHLMRRTGLLAYFELRDSIERAVADLLPPE